MRHALTLTLIAIYRDEEQIQAYRSVQAAKSSIDVYSCAGKLIRRITVRGMVANLARHVLTEIVG